LCGIIIGKQKNHTTTITTTTPPPPPPRCDYNSGSSRQPRKLIFGMQPYSNPTRRIMEDSLNIFENGRRPQFFLKEDDLNFVENGR
jgi:hypothetical protein